MTIALNQPWPYLFILQILVAMTLMSSNLESFSANANAPKELMNTLVKKRAAHFNNEMMENGEVVPVLAYFANPAINYENSAVKRGRPAPTAPTTKRNWRTISPYAFSKRSARLIKNKRSLKQDWLDFGGTWFKRSPRLTETN